MGIGVGIVTLVIFAAARIGTLAGIHIGIVALILNVIAAISVSALTGAYRRSGT